MGADNNDWSGPWIDMVKYNIGRIERLKRNVNKTKIELEKETIYEGVVDGTLVNLFKQFGIKRGAC